MRRTLLALVLLAVALPAAGQTTLGVRAGVGMARMELSDDVFFAPCLPDEPCPGFPTDPAYSFTFGADLTVPLALEYEIRVGGRLTANIPAGDHVSLTGTARSATPAVPLHSESWNRNRGNANPK